MVKKAPSPVARELFDPYKLDFDDATTSAALDELGFEIVEVAFRPLEDFAQHEATGSNGYAACTDVQMSDRRELERAVAKAKFEHYEKHRKRKVQEVQVRMKRVEPGKGLRSSRRESPIGTAFHGVPNAVSGASAEIERKRLEGIKRRQQKEHAKAKANRLEQARKLQKLKAKEEREKKREKERGAAKRKERDAEEAWKRKAFLDKQKREEEKDRAWKKELEKKAAQKARMEEELLRKFKEDKKRRKKEAAGRRQKQLMRQWLRAKNLALREEQFDKTRIRMEWAERTLYLRIQAKKERKKAQMLEERERASARIAAALGAAEKLRKHKIAEFKERQRMAQERKAAWEVKRDEELQQKAVDREIARQHALANKEKAELLENERIEEIIRKREAQEEVYRTECWRREVARMAKNAGHRVDEEFKHHTVRRLRELDARVRRQTLADIEMGDAKTKHIKELKEHVVKQLQVERAKAFNRKHELREEMLGHSKPKNGKPKHRTPSPPTAPQPSNKKRRPNSARF
jgi:hypothetical protein